MRRTIETDVDVDVQRTLGPLAHGKRAHRVTDEGVWRATRTPEGPATLLVSGAGRSISTEAWGPGAAWALDRLPELIGLDDPAEEFQPTGPLARVQRRFPGMRFGRTRSVFEPTLNAIIGQKVPGRSAKQSYLSLFDAYGEPAPGPAPLRLQPRPEVLAALPYEAYHPHNLERKRADTIRAAAHRASRLEEAAWMSSEDAMRRLTAFPGIGAWTATQVVQVALGDADAVVVGDYNLPKLVTWNLAGEPRGKDERMLELLEPYRPHRARVVRLLKAGGARPPRYGPRLELMDISRR